MDLWGYVGIVAAVAFLVIVYLIMIYRRDKKKRQEESLLVEPELARPEILGSTFTESVTNIIPSAPTRQDLVLEDREALVSTSTTDDVQDNGGPTPIYELTPPDVIKQPSREHIGYYYAITQLKQKSSQDVRPIPKQSSTTTGSSSERQQQQQVAREQSQAVLPNYEQPIRKHVNNNKNNSNSNNGNMQAADYRYANTQNPRVVESPASRTTSPVIPVDYRYVNTKDVRTPSPDVVPSTKKLRKSSSPTSSTTTTAGGKKEFQIGHDYRQIPFRAISTDQQREENETKGSVDEKKDSSHSSSSSPSSHVLYQNVSALLNHDTGDNANTDYIEIAPTDVAIYQNTQEELDFRILSQQQQQQHGQKEELHYQNVPLQRTGPILANLDIENSNNKTSNRSSSQTSDVISSYSIDNNRPTNGYDSEDVDDLPPLPPIPTTTTNTNNTSAITTSTLISTTSATLKNTTTVPRGVDTIV